MQEVYLHISSYHLHIQENLSMLAVSRQIASHVGKFGALNLTHEEFSAAHAEVQQARKTEANVPALKKVQPV